jgi:hypothetical protein
LKIDLQTGSQSLLAQLPEDSLLSIATAEEGIYFTNDGEILILDWDGKTRVVSSAMLD